MKHCLYRLVLTGTMYLFFSFSSLAQTGPGGIGNRTGGSILEVWLDAGDLDGDDITTDNPANATAVSTWTDKSGNANNLTQGTAGNQPAYATGTFNGVQFTNSGAVGTLDYMTFAIPSHFSPGTAYFVLNATDAGTASNTLLDDATRSLRWEQFDDTNNLGYTRYGVNDYVSSLVPNYGANTIVAFLKSNASNNVEVRQNNATTNLNIGSNGEGIPLTRMGATLAADGANYKLMETIVYSSVLNAAQVRIMENYLSAKYGSITISNDDYVMDNAGRDFDFDVAGIGQTGGTSHSDAASSIVEINNPGSLANGDFLYFGHNGASTQSNTTDVPATVVRKLQRIWGVSELGNVGTVTVSFDLTGLGTVTASDLRLLIDTDNDGVFNETSPTTTIVSGATAAGGNIYQFSGLGLNYGTFQFTLGTINATQTPLPVELVNFKSKSNDGKVTLTWETATEINNDFFTLYRSVDGLKYSEIARVPGNGNSNQPRNYDYVDNTPPFGRVYYRLKQTDHDGTEEYVGITTTEVTFKNSKPFVYPNPVKRGSWITVQLLSESEGALDFKLLSMTGQSTSLEFTSSNGETKVFIPESVTPGPYVISTISGATSHNRIKVVVQ